MARSKDYTFAVARIRAKELSLLSDSDISTLMSSKTYNECINMLADKGWNTEDFSDYEDILENQEDTLWQLMSELADDLSEFNVFFYQKDYQNLKASIKAVITNSDTEGLFFNSGSISAKKIYEAVKNKDYNSLPEHLQKCAEIATTTLLQTRDGQLCDIIIDQYALTQIYNQGINSNSEIIKLYAETFVSVANIKTAVRCNKTGKSLNFIKQALAQCSSLNIDMLAKSAAMNIEEIYNYLMITEYKGAVDALKQSASAFEIWCDNMLTKSMQPQKWEPFTIGPLVAYILAKENEIKTVRIILSAKLNNLDSQIIKERLRKMYV